MAVKFSIVHVDIASLTWALPALHYHYFFVLMVVAHLGGHGDWTCHGKLCASVVHSICPEDLEVNMVLNGHRNHKAY